MSGVDVVKEVVERQVPVRPQMGPDWGDVLARVEAGAPTALRSGLSARRLALAAAAVLGVLVAATALAASLGGFEDWLRGTPGKPAPASEQRRFEAANGRSWASFPTGTELRELIRTRVAEREYVLYGFRSGRSLCLRLNAVSLSRPAQGCAPVSTLAHLSGPMLVITHDLALADGQISFGIVADGVKRVEVRTVSGTHRALLGGNAYLFVENEPNTGNRVLSISAIDANGRRTNVTRPPRFLSFLASGVPRGPTKLEARIAHPKVGWHLRNENRGVSPDQVKLTAEQRRALADAATLGHLRLIKPDPTSDVVVGLAGNLCQFAMSGSGGGVSKSCSPVRDFFSRGPVNWGITGTGYSQFSLVHGVVADGVAHVRIFLADGQRLAAPLRNNVFASLVGEEHFPIRLVAYDARGRIVGIETSPVFHEPIPDAARRLRPALRVRGPNGVSGVLRVGQRVSGYQCWRVDFGTGESPSGCVWPNIVDLVQPAGRDLFIIGSTYDAVSRVELQFEDGSVRSMRPVKGHFVLAIPRDYLRTSRQSAMVVGFNQEGRTLQRRAVVFRTR